MSEEAIQILREKDSYAAIEFLSAGPDPVTTARALDETMRTLYWKQKDLDGSIAMGRAGVQFALLAGNGAGADAGVLRGIAKSISYNLASFTWPGWDEAGIAVTRTHVAIGLDAARTNLRLAAELDKGSLAMSRACWILAAQQLAAGDAQSAIDQFSAGARHATKAGRPADELLNLGFAQLATVLLSGEDTDRDELNEILNALNSTEEGRMFAAQIKTAEDVFNRPEWAIAPGAATLSGQEARSGS